MSGKQNSISNLFLFLFKSLVESVKNELSFRTASRNGNAVNLMGSQTSCNILKKKKLFAENLERVTVFQIIRVLFGYARRSYYNGNDFWWLTVHCMKTVSLIMELRFAKIVVSNLDRL